MMFGAGWELRHMSISELMHRPERARRLEVFTGAGRRRTFPADEKAAIVAESYAPGRTGCRVARRHGLTSAQLFTWRRLARRVRLPVQEPPVRFVPAVVEALPGLPPPPTSQPRRARPGPPPPPPAPPRAPPPARARHGDRGGDRRHRGHKHLAGGQPKAQRLL